MRKNDIFSLQLHKLRYFSTHDSVINAVLAALDLYENSEERWPGFVADISIELWKRVNDQKVTYFVKLYYQDKVCSLLLVI